MIIVTWTLSAAGQRTRAETGGVIRCLIESRILYCSTRFKLENLVAEFIVDDVLLVLYVVEEDECRGPSRTRVTGTIFQFILDANTRVADSRASAADCHRVLAEETARQCPC